MINQSQEWAFNPQGLRRKASRADKAELEQQAS
jgi:hypothetical protein